MKLLLIIIFCLMTQSCASSFARVARANNPKGAEQIGYVYPGVTVEVVAIGSGTIFTFLGIIDWIPTLVLDTVLLPYDGVCYMINGKNCKDEKK